MGWFNPRIGLGRVGLGWVELGRVGSSCFQFLIGWVGSNVEFPKVLVQA